MTLTKQVKPESEMKEYVSDVMNPDPHTVSKTASLVEATQEMLSNDCGFLIVTDNGKPDGVITDRDIVIFGIAEGKDPKSAKVEELMTKQLITCYQNETLAYAADHISENDIRRLVVLDENDKLAGVVSIVDMIKHVEDDSINFEVIKHLFKYA